MVPPPLVEGAQKPFHHHHQRQPPQLAPFHVKEQQLYSALLLDFQTPFPTVALRMSSTTLWRKLTTSCIHNLVLFFWLQITKPYVTTGIQTNWWTKSFVLQLRSLFTTLVRYNVWMTASAAKICINKSNWWSFFPHLKHVSAAWHDSIQFLHIVSQSTLCNVKTSKN